MRFCMRVSTCSKALKPRSSRRSAAKTRTSSCARTRFLTVSKLILHACLSRKTSSEPLFFKRTDSTETDPERDRRFITVRQENGEVIYGSHPLYYFGDLETEYEKRNGDYIKTEQKGAYRK